MDWISSYIKYFGIGVYKRSVYEQGCFLEVDDEFFFLDGGFWFGWIRG